jgi:RNA polymerase sigma-70 factor (ECF subfamily)
MGESSPRRENREEFIPSEATQAAFEAQIFLSAVDSNNPESEASLAAKYKARTAFDEVTRLTYSQMLEHAERHLGRKYRDNAEDVTQDVYEKAYKKLLDFRGDSQVESYLYGGIHNRAIDYIRILKRQDLVGSEEDFEKFIEPIDDAFYEVVETRLSLKDAFDSLSSKKKIAIFLLIAAGLTYEEISRREKIPVGTLKSWVTRGKREIRDRMGND